MKSNVLLFVCDDLRWNALSGMGHPEVKTPHIDQLMTDGASFTRCYMPGGSDGAVCMPSRAMLHTGRSLFEIDREGQEIPEGHTSIGQHLQLHGYNCFHTGKWHNGVASFARSFNDGDEIFFGGMGDQYNMPLHRFDPSGRYESRIARAPDAFHSKELEFQSGDHTSDGKHATDVFIDAADSYIRRRQDSDTPFLLSIALTAPHDPRTAPPNFHEQYNPEDTTLPENFLAYHPHQTGALNSRDENLASHPRKPEEIKEHIADYHAMIAHLDEGLGKLSQAL
ncbi:MAG: sulfatase-like hydrolase/transferase, partial [Verrucomicrobiota bacterium]